MTSFLNQTSDTSSGNGKSFLSPSNAQQSQPSVLSQAASNFFPSLGNVIKGVGNAIVHPIQTGQALLNTGIGEGEKLANKVLPAVGLPKFGVNPTTISGQLNQTAQDTATRFNENFLGGAFAGKGVEGLKTKFANDPAGLLLDVATLGDGLGAAFGKIGDLADSGVLSKIGSTFDKAGALNPISAPIKIAGKIAEKIGTPSESTVANMEDLKSVGVNPKTAPIQATSRGGMISTAANFIKTGIFGGKITDQVNSTLSDLKNTADTIVKSFPDSLDNPSLGQKIIDAKNLFEKNQGAATNKLYTDIEEKYGQAPAKIDNTVQAIQNQIKYLETSAFPDSEGMIKKLNTTLDNLQYGRGDFSNYSDQGYTPEALKKLGVTNTYTPTVDTLKSTRTAIGALTQKDPALFGPIYSALTKDRLATVNAINPEAGAEISKADNLYRTTIQKLGSSASNLIDKGSPEGIVKTFVAGNNSTALNSLKSIVDPETYSQIGLSWMKHTIDKATDPTTGVLNVKAFTDGINKLDAPTKNALFNPDQIAKLDQSIKTLQTVQKIQDALTKNSTPGKFIQNSMILRSMGLPITVMLGGGKFLMTYLAGMMGGEFIGSKLFSSQLGKSILSTGSEGLTNLGKTTSKIGSVVGKAAQGSNILNKNQQ